MADAGRYHLYISYACPWCSRAVVMRALKGLQDAVTMTALDPVRDQHGWHFTAETPDPLHGWKYLSEAYRADDPAFSGRATAPLLWDKQAGRIASVDSAEIMRLFNSDFNDVARYPERDYYPQQLRDRIDALNERIGKAVNAGVYSAGTAAGQAQHEQAIRELFAELGELERTLTASRYLTGDQLTEADWRLAITLFRFDPVYVGLFKCNIRPLIDHPNLWAYARELYQHPGVAETVRFDEIKRHYYCDPALNPTRIIPAGPQLDWNEPHGRS